MGNQSGKSSEDSRVGRGRIRPHHPTVYLPPQGYGGQQPGPAGASSYFKSASPPHPALSSGDDLQWETPPSSPIPNDDLRLPASPIFPELTDDSCTTTELDSTGSDTRDFPANRVLQSRIVENRNFKVSTGYREDLELNVPESSQTRLPRFRNQNLGDSVERSGNQCISVGRAGDQCTSVGRAGDQCTSVGKELIEEIEAGEGEWHDSDDREIWQRNNPSRNSQVKEQRRTPEMAYNRRTNVDYKSRSTFPPSHGDISFSSSDVDTPNKSMETTKKKKVPTATLR